MHSFPVTVRRLHLVLGLSLALYVAIVSLTGAVLLFRLQIQRMLHPDLFTPRTTGTLAAPVAVMDAMTARYPDHRLAGVEAPTTARPTYLAYVSKDSQFRTVLIDPVSADILGELPEDSTIRFVQSLHSNLLLGRAGRNLHGAGAIALIVLALSGLLLWWKTAAARSRGLSVPVLHRAVGLAAIGFILMWSVTGLYFVFPSAWRAALHRISPVTVSRTPRSADLDAAAIRVRRDVRELLEIARAQAPNQHVARVVLPADERAAFLVMFAQESPTPVGRPLHSVYLDQYSGRHIVVTAERTFSDRVLAWIVPLHIGTFGGAVTKTIWLVLALAPVLLSVTGVWMWRSRAGRARRPV